MTLKGLLLLWIAAGFVLTPAQAADLPDWWTAPLGGEQPAPPVPAGGESVAGLPPGGDASLRCLAQAIAYEAGNEPLAGRQAVAQVVLNRVQSLLYPKTVCGVVFQGAERRTGCQFTFTCDGSLKRPLSRRTWEAALAVAQQALSGQLPQTVGAATHYHANYVFPRWAPSLVRVGAIGAHIFYRFPRATAPQLAGGAAPPPVPAESGFSLWGLSAASVAKPAS